jgi:hypothetical protein
MSFIPNRNNQHLLRDLRAVHTADPQGQLWADAMATTLTDATPPRQPPAPADRPPWTPRCWPRSATTTAGESSKVAGQRLAWSASRWRVAPPENAQAADLGVHASPVCDSPLFLLLRKSREPYPALTA